MGLAKPVHAEVSATWNGWKRVSHFLYVCWSKLLLHFVFRLEGGIADDGVGFGPGGEESISAENILVEVVEREVAFEFEGVGVLAGEFIGMVGPEFFGVAMGEAAGEHERD